jgi:hypothetical protein
LLPKFPHASVYIFAVTMRFGREVARAWEMDSGRGERLANIVCAIGMKGNLYLVKDINATLGGDFGNLGVSVGMEFVERHEAIV